MPSPHPQALPDHDRAVIPDAKLRAYALNTESELGAHKARLFDSILGFTQENAAELKTAILAGLPSAAAMPKLCDGHGARFQVDVPITGPRGQGVVRTGWILPNDGSPPRLITAIVLKGKS